MGAMVVKDLRAGATGAGIAHAPEIILFAATGEAPRVDAHLIQPYGGGLIVLLINRHPELFGRQAEAPGEKLPGETDGFAFEVITKGKIAEHLEKGVVAGGIADVFQVVVLAAGAYAALRGGRPPVRPRLQTEEDILELHHAGIGKEQRGVIARDEVAGGDYAMPIFGKVIEKGLTNQFRLHVSSIVKKINKRRDRRRGPGGSTRW